MARPFDPFAGLAEPGDWARVGIFLVNRRTGERKLAPKFQGAEPGLAKPAPERSTLGRLADAVAGAAITPGAPGLLTSPGVAPRFADAVAAGGATPGLAYEAARDGIDKLKAKAAEVARNVREAEIQRDGVSAQDLARAKKTTTQVFGKPAAPTPRLPAAMQQVAKLPAESRDAYLEGLAAQGASPLAAALADTTVEGAAIVADPTNLLPGAGALKASSLLDGSLFAAARQKAAQEGLETAGARAVRKALGEVPIAPPAGVVTPKRAISPELRMLQAQSLAIGEDLPEEALQRVTGGAGPVVEAMPHAGSDVSIEAINRVARQDRYVRVTPGGEVRPIINDVGAVDVKVNPGEVKAVLGKDGQLTIEQGRPNPAQQRALQGLTSEAPSPARALPEDEPDVYDLGDLDEVATPRNPEAGFVKVPEAARSLSRWLTENFEGGGPSQGMFNAAAMDFPRGSAEADFAQSVPRRIEGMQGRYNVAMRTKDEILRDLGKVMKKAAPSKAGRQALYRDMHLAATGQIPLTDVPVELRPFVTQGRDLIDELTDRGIATGAFPNELLPTIQASRGKYMHRTYAAHREKHWLARNENKPDWYAAIDGLDRELNRIEVGHRVETPQGTGRIERFSTVNPSIATVKLEQGGGLVHFDKGQLRGANYTRDQVIGEIRRMADKENGPQVVLNYAGPPNRKNAILQRRNNIPAEVRKFLGEDEDFRISLEKTVHNQAWDIEAHAMWKEIGDDGLAAGVFRPADQGPADILYQQVAGSESASGLTSKSPVSGLFTSPAMKRALANEMELAKVGFMQKLAGYVKSAKVSQSIQSLNRNFLANPAAIVANGQGRALVDPTQWGKIKAAMASPSQMRRAIELGIRENGAMAGEMLEYIRFIEGGGKVSKAFRSVAKLGARYQQWGDDFWRTLAWLKESEDLAWAKGIPLPEAEELAADRVKDTFQTYSRLNRMSRRLARNPIVGSPGVSFAFESARNVKNIAKIGALDLAEGIRTGNPRMVYLGMRRYVGLTAAAMLPIAAQKASMAALGMRRDQEEAFRSQVAPDYAKNTTMLFTEFEPGKEVGYVDIGWMDPYSAIRKPLVASWRTVNEGAPAPEVAYEVLNSIAGGDILAETTLEVAFGQRMRSLWPPKMGGQFTAEDAPLGNKLKARGYRAYQGLAPGYVVSGEKLARGAGVLSDTTASGQKYTLKGEAAGLAGFRFTKMEIPTAYRRQAAEIAGRTRAIRSDLRATGRTAGPAKAGADYVYSWGQVYGDVAKAVSAFRLLGMTDQEIGQTGSEAGVPPSMLAAALAGSPIPPPPVIRADDADEAALAQEVFNAYSKKYGMR